MRNAIVAPMESAARELKHRELNNLVTMAEAALAAYAQSTGNASTIPSVTGNLYAELLSRLIPLYALSEDRQQVRALTRADIDGGMFRDGGREIWFPDGRPPIRGLALTRTALKAAIEVLKRANADDVPPRRQADSVAKH
jgi:hypothetical protein